MRKIIFFLIVLFANCIFAQNPKGIVNSDIKEVKVFLSGAMITRNFKTTLESGVTQLAVENLSSQVDPNSITCSASSDAMILSTSYSLDYLKENKVSPELKRLKDSLESLNNDMGQLSMLESVYNDEAGMLNSNKAVGGSNIGVSADNLHKVIDFYRQRMIEVKSKLLEIAQKKTKLAEKIRRVNEQIQVENGKLNRPYGTVFITVSAKQRTNADFELSYFAQGASWQPTYDLRAKDVNGPVSLLYKAIVTQNTGENWDNVHVALSTGNPTLGGNKPELQQWFLRFYQQYEKELTIRGSRSDKMEMAPQVAQEMYDSIVPAGAVTYNWSMLEENQLVTEFEITSPYTVSTDGKEVTMDIQSYTLPATYAYFSAPKLDKDAFLMASITGWEKLSLLPGNSNVYLENSYVGQSYINPSITTDTLKLSFGRDKRIVIKRERIKDVNSAQFIGGNVEKEFVYEISVRNTKKENVTVTIEDQVPLSTDASIKITTGELTNGNYTQATGMVNWKLELKPGETQKVRIGYKVKYPKDKVIGGL